MAGKHLIVGIVMFVLASASPPESPPVVTTPPQAEPPIAAAVKDVLHRQHQQLIPATSYTPAMLCQKVFGQNGKEGLLCKPLPPTMNASTQQSDIDAVMVKIAADIAHQAKELHKPAHTSPTMHIEAAVYQWQLSSTFVFISNKRHYYNVHYADSSALKIKTGEDVFKLGPYRVLTRFGLIEEAVSGRPGADLQGADGILGFGYSDWRRSASVMKTLTRSSRPSWNIVQPRDMTTMKHNVFSILTSTTRGELQLGGYDPESFDGDIMWTKMRNESGYGVLITSVKYKGHELLYLGDEGKRVGGVVGVFDTGSTCIEMPRGLFKDYYASSLFDNFARVASADPSHPLEVVLDGGHTLYIPLDVWSEPWGCTNPFAADNVMLLGHHTYKAYMVVHDMSQQEYRMGFAKIRPSYLPKLGTMETTSVPDDGNGIAKVQLHLESRVHLFIYVAIGTPPQRFRCVFDTGSILLAVFSGNVTSAMVNATVAKRGGRKDEGWLSSIMAPHLWMLPGWNLPSSVLQAMGFVCCGVLLALGAMKLRMAVQRRFAARQGVILEQDPDWGWVRVVKRGDEGSFLRKGVHAHMRG